MYGLRWQANLQETEILDIALTPYLFAITLSTCAILLRPPQPLQHSPVHKALFAFPVQEYLAVIRHGRFELLAAIVVGTSINLLVQYIDLFAPANLLPGNSVASRTLNIFAFNLTVVLMVAALNTYLYWRSPSHDLSHDRRELIIAAALCTAVVLVYLSLQLDESTGIGALQLAPILLGIAQSALLAMLPLIKSWVLDYAFNGLRATALSLLGIAKRSLGIGATLGIYLASDSPTQEEINSQTVFLVLVAFAIFCLTVLAAHTLFRHYIKTKPL